MSARKEISINHKISKLGIIAGAGAIPAHLKQACEAQNIACFIVGLAGNTDEVTPNYWARIGQAEKIITRLREENISNIVMIGAVKTPNLWNVWPDWTAFKFFLKCWLKSFGDNNMLLAARTELEAMGFKLHGVHQFLPELLMRTGNIGKIAPNANQQKDIDLGIAEARALGRADIGQAVLVKDNQIIARENKCGTSWMIKKHGKAGAILVKMCKPQQDQDLDLPTIGPETLRLCADKNMAGIVGHAGQSLLVERDQVKKLADGAGIFVTGAELND